MVDNRVFLNMERYLQLKKILSDVTVPYAVIKGEPLSLLCYNKKSVRNSQDIDILIDRQHISKKYDIFEVSKRIGHKSIKTTQDIYGHLFDDVQKTIADDLDKLRRG